MTLARCALPRTVPGMRTRVAAWIRAHIEATHHTLYTAGATAVVIGAAGLAAEHAGPAAGLAAAGLATIATTVGHARCFTYMPDEPAHEQPVDDEDDA